MLIELSPSYVENAGVGLTVNPSPQKRNPCWQNVGATDFFLLLFHTQPEITGKPGRKNPPSPQAAI